MSATVKRLVSRLVLMATFLGVLALAPQAAFAAQPEAAAAGAAPVRHGGEASLVVPDLSSVSFLGIDDQKFRGGAVHPVGLDETVVFTTPGIERFMTLPLDQTEG